MVHKVHGDAVVVVVMEACLRNKETVAMLHPPRIRVVEGAVTDVEGVVTDAEHLVEDLHLGS